MTGHTTNFITMQDGTQIYYKDGGTGLAEANTAAPLALFDNTTRRKNCDLLKTTQEQATHPALLFACLGSPKADESLRREKAANWPL